MGVNRLKVRAGASGAWETVRPTVVRGLSFCLLTLTCGHKIASLSFLDLCGLGPQPR